MKWVCDGVYELAWSGGACGAGFMYVESSHCLSNRILDGKVWMLNENDNDDDDDCGCHKCVPCLNMFLKKQQRNFK